MVRTMQCSYFLGFRRLVILAIARFENPRREELATRVAALRV